MSLKRYCAALLGAVLLFCACASPHAASDPAPTEQPHGEPSTGKIAFELIGKDGNDMIYDKSHVTPDPSSPLSGKKVYWLGSSVTYGAGSNGQSMAHFMAVKDGVTSVVEAMSGTTLMTGETKPETSYVNRLLASEKFDKNTGIDAFICQISTNDAKASNLSQTGALTGPDVTDPEAFDLSTTAGAIEFIIRYVHDTWHCPVIFYSGSYFGDEGERSNNDPAGSDYARLVALALDASEKWNKIEGYDVSVLDLYHDEAFNALVSETDYAYLMRDPVHPRKAGYLLWWLPAFEQFLEQKCS